MPIKVEMMIFGCERSCPKMTHDVKFIICLTHRTHNDPIPLARPPAEEVFLGFRKTPHLHLHHDGVVMAPNWPNHVPSSHFHA